MDTKEYKTLYARILQEKPQKADVIVWLQGDRYDRAAKTIELYRGGWSNTVLICGNDVLLGKQLRPGEDNVSLEAMRDFLIKEGVKSEDIAIDADALNTKEQAIHVVKMAKTKGWEKIILVGSSYYQSRVLLTFLEQGQSLGWGGRFINQPAIIGQNEKPGGRDKTASELFEEEFEKIKKYAPDMATLAEGIKYLDYANNPSSQKAPAGRRKITIIIQARMGSTRLPGKVLLDLAGKPVLQHVIERVLRAKNASHIIIATTDKKADDILVDFLEKLQNPKVTVFRGSEDDVLDRYYQAAKEHATDVVVRITSDCPVIDPQVLDYVIDAFFDKGVDYAANVLDKRTYPRGLDMEVFSFDALQTMAEKATEKPDREHVTLYLRRQPHLFKTYSVSQGKDYSGHRWTLDEKEDYELLKTIYKNVYHENQDFGMEEVITFLEQNPEVVKINAHIEQKKI